MTSEDYKRIGAEFRAYLQAQDKIDVFAVRLAGARSKIDMPKPPSMFEWAESVDAHLLDIRAEDLPVNL